jgi:hypothetical protein
MTLRISVVAVAAALSGCTSAALNTTDKPFLVAGDEVTRYEASIKPYSEKARSTYPDAKRRFLAGLPKGNTFYVTALIVDTPDQDGSRRFEQVFIAVRAIRDERIYGYIASELNHVREFKSGAPYDLPESELRDWTIVRPDGTEEGNYVGKFLDTLH